MTEFALILVIAALLLHAASLFAKSKKPVGLFSMIVGTVAVVAVLDSSTAPYSYTEIGVLCLMIYVLLMGIVSVVNRDGE